MNDNNTCIINYLNSVVEHDPFLFNPRKFIDCFANKPKMNLLMRRLICTQFFCYEIGKYFILADRGMHTFLIE